MKHKILKALAIMFVSIGVAIGAAFILIVFLIDPKLFFTAMVIVGLATGVLWGATYLQDNRK